MGVLFMDRITKINFNKFFKYLVMSYRTSHGTTDFNISKLFSFSYVRFNRFKNGNSPAFPNLKELKEIEEFFKVDLKEYYPTQCEIAQAYIMKRLNNGIKITDMSKLLGYYCNHSDLMVIESSNYSNYGEKQRKIYDDFMNLVIKS